MNDEEVREEKEQKKDDLKMWIGFYVLLVFMTLGTIASVLIIMWFIKNGL